MRRTAVSKQVLETNELCDSKQSLWGLLFSICWQQLPCQLAPVSQRILSKKYRDRRGNVLKGRHRFVVPCCVYFVLFCLGCPEQLIKLFANSPGQARQDTGQEVSIYRQNRTECLSSFQCPYLQCSWWYHYTSDAFTGRSEKIFRIYQFCGRKWK